VKLIFGKWAGSRKSLFEKFELDFTAFESDENLFFPN
jgi:hypothetical protein